MRDIRGARISMIMQDPRWSRNPVMKVGDQIAEAFRTHSTAGRRTARARALEMLETVQIRDVEKVYQIYPHQVSGGMGQRVMIAKMLIPNLLQTLQRERGLTYPMVGHNLAVVAHMCGREIAASLVRFD